LKSWYRKNPKKEYDLRLLSVSRSLAEIAIFIIHCSNQFVRRNSMKVSALFIVALIAFGSPIAFAAEEQQKPMSEKEMQEQLKKMEKEIAEMRETKNPEKRKEMMNQHMEHMGHMHDMMMNGMGCCAGGQQ
jgi:uncharacterized membrane protein (DUF106 family)